MKKFLIYNPVTKIATIETEEEIDNEEFLEGSTNADRGIQVRELSPAEEQQLEKGPTALQQFGRGLLSLGENDVKGIAGSAGRMLRDIIGETVTKGLIRRKAPMGQLGDLGVEIGGAGVMGAADALDDERDRATIEGDDIDLDEALKGGLGGLLGGAVGTGVGALGGKLLKGAGESLITAKSAKLAREQAEAGLKKIDATAPAEDAASRAARSAAENKKGAVPWEALQSELKQLSDIDKDLLLNQDYSLPGKTNAETAAIIKSALEALEVSNEIDFDDMPWDDIQALQTLAKMKGLDSLSELLMSAENTAGKQSKIAADKIANAKKLQEYHTPIADKDIADVDLTDAQRAANRELKRKELTDAKDMAVTRQRVDDAVSFPSSVGSAGGMRLMSEIMTEPSIKGKPLKEVTPSDIWTAIKGVPARFNRVDDRIKAEDRDARIKAMALAELDPMFAGRRAMEEDTARNNSWAGEIEREKASAAKSDEDRKMSEGEAAMIEDTKARRRAAAHADDLEDIPSAHEYDAGQSLPDRGEPIGTEYELGMGPDVSDDDLELMRLLGYIEDEE